MEKYIDYSSIDWKVVPVDKINYVIREFRAKGELCREYWYSIMSIVNRMVSDSEAIMQEDTK